MAQAKKTAPDLSKKDTPDFKKLAEHIAKPPKAEQCWQGCGRLRTAARKPGPAAPEQLTKARARVARRRR